MKNLLETVLSKSLDEIALSKEAWEAVPLTFGDILETLTLQEQHVITLRYNLDGNKTAIEEKYNVKGWVRKRKNLPLRLIGREMAELIKREQPFSQERVRQIETDALRKLRHPSHPKRRESIKTMLGLEDKISWAEFLNLAGEFYPSPSPSQKEHLAKPVAELELSVRAANCLEAANIVTIRDLVVHAENEMLRYRNFGRRALNELKDILEKMGLGFGMTLEE